MTARVRTLALAVVWLLACAGLARLGLWQLDRGAEKCVRYAAFSERHQQPVAALDDLAHVAAGAELAWRRVTVRGRYGSPHVLLDNRVREGRAGYELLTPFTSDGGLRLLVDRGWLPLAGGRAAAPQVDAPGGAVSLSGYLGPPPVSGITLSDGLPAVEWLATDIARVQQVHIDTGGRLAGVELNETLSPMIIYLDATAAGARDARWQLPGSGAERHQAYAVQWFAMAAILAAIGLWQWRKRVAK